MARTFTQKTLNGFEMIQRPAACEIPCWLQGHRSFIGIYPPSARTKKWLVRRFSIPDNLINEYFGENELVDSIRLELSSLKEVEELLADWSIDASLFDAPSRSDYPL